MKRILPTRFVFGALVALFWALPSVALARSLTVSGYADFEAVLENVDKDPDDVFKSQCAACHGEGGAGDGIAAVAFNPKPTDFTSAEWAAARTADQVETVITDGFNAMPPYGEVLSAGEIKDLAAYLRNLSNKPAG